MAGVLKWNRRDGTNESTLNAFNDYYPASPWSLFSPPKLEWVLRVRRRSQVTLHHPRPTPLYSAASSVGCRRPCSSLKNLRTNSRIADDRLANSRSASMLLINRDKLTRRDLAISCRPCQKSSSNEILVFRFLTTTVCLPIEDFMRPFSPCPGNV